MGVLDQVTQMKNQGISENEIVDKLREQGVSPKEINNALSQAQIKEAVAGEEEPSAGGYSYETPPKGIYTPQIRETSNIPKEDFYAAPEQTQQEYVPQPAQQEYYQPETYPEYSYQNTAYQHGMIESTDSDTTIEIAEQVFSEKIKEIQKKIDSIEEFKTLAQTKIEIISERLKRIETIIDKLQITILEKVGSYGKGLENAQNELSMVQDSFRKIMSSKSSSSGRHSKNK